MPYSGLESSYDVILTNHRAAVYGFSKAPRPDFASYCPVRTAWEDVFPGLAISAAPQENGHIVVKYLSYAHAY